MFVRDGFDEVEEKLAHRPLMQQRVTFECRWTAADLLPSSIRWSRDYVELRVGGRPARVLRWAEVLEMVFLSPSAVRFILLQEAIALDLPEAAVTVLKERRRRAPRA